ncbi:MAG TPA: type II secretion system F family protein [Candidatus Acidoferrales bacterium]|nr:type II secretion system F family protein [Candidatus Acidoferrales bacterium]
MSLTFVIVAGTGFFVALFAVFLLVSRPSKESVLLVEASAQAYQAPAEEPEWGWIDLERMARPFVRIRSLFSSQPNAEVAGRLLQAGYRKPEHADIFTGAKLLLPVIFGASVALYVKRDVILWFFVSIAVAFLIPEFWLARAIRNRRAEIKLSLPDALDLLAICIEAGLGLDQAIVKVGAELKISHPELSQEILQINLEQRAGSPRVAAWRSMADRVQVESVRSFVNMLVQTERFGTPIAKSLAIFSGTLRTERRQQAEESAAKTTIKLVLPLVFFIFPSIFIVTVVPAILTIMKSFGTMLN